MANEKTEEKFVVIDGTDLILGRLGSTIAKTFENVTVYGRNNNPVQDTHDIIIIAAPCGSRITVEQNPEKDRLDCDKVIDTLSKCVYNKLIHII